MDALARSADQAMLPLRIERRKSRQTQIIALPTMPFSRRYRFGIVSVSVSPVIRAAQVRYGDGGDLGYSQHLRRVAVNLNRLGILDWESASFEICPVY